MLWTQICRIGSSGSRLKPWSSLIFSKCSINSSNQPKEGLSGPFPLKYESHEVELGWYDWWKKRGYFQPDLKSKGSPFTLLLPPPNVTGILHLGHALSTTIQDVIVRRKRMQGYKVSWMPGSDHAGIATQVVVEKILAKKGVSRHSLGREEFLAKVWEWKHEKGGVIFEQLARLGASLDWNRTTFTMDQNHSEAVIEAFVQLFDKGLVYRALAPINWSTQLQSAISDIEVDHLSVETKTSIPVPGYDKPVEFGVMFDVAYKVEGSEEEIIISTTRPETILGDMAVAVHPDDERYSNLVGRRLVHPFRSDTIPVIADTYVDPQFGTGALKITPAHDSNDFDIGLRHGLPMMETIDTNGSIVNSNSDLDGLPRFTARGRIIDELKKLGLFRGSKSHDMQIPICSRTGDVVEKLVQPQWFIRCEQTAAKAMDVASNGQLKFHPNSYHNVWKHWLENTRDWCVSRQIWWGHRIPVWKGQVKGQEDQWIAARNKTEARAKAEDHFQTKEIVLIQEEDVLDTWFSSAILPFANVGWPNMESNENGFPNSFLETGHDILFFWVARMVMLSLELTSKVPFPDVLLHGVVCDSQGRKMSKSLGNVIDPMDIIQGTSLEEMCLEVRKANANGRISDQEMEKAVEGVVKDFPEGLPACGADGLRFFFFVYDIKAQQINVDTSILKSSSNFCNKIWQASRFLVGSLDRSPTLIPWKMEPSIAQNRWILSRLAVTVREVNEHLDNYDFHLTSQALRRFMYTNLCDVYLESIKHILADPCHPNFQETASVLHQAVISGLTLLHPICPFITEELYHRIPLLEGEVRSESMMIQSYPSYCDFKQYEDSSLMDGMEKALDLVTAIRNLKKNYDLKRHHKPKITVQISEDDKLNHTLLPLKDAIIHLCQIESILWTKDISTLDPRCSTKSSFGENMWIWMDIQGMLDLENEFVKITTSRSQIRKQLDKLNEKLSKRKHQGSQTRNVEKVAKLEQTLVDLDEREAWLKTIKQ